MQKKTLANQLIDNKTMTSENKQFGFGEKRFSRSEVEKFQRDNREWINQLKLENNYFLNSVAQKYDANAAATAIAWITTLLNEAGFEEMQACKASGFVTYATTKTDPIPVVIELANRIFAVKDQPDFDFDHILVEYGEEITPASFDDNGYLPPMALMPTVVLMFQAIRDLGDPMSTDSATKDCEICGEPCVLPHNKYSGHIHAECAVCLVAGKTPIASDGTTVRQNALDKAIEFLQQKIQEQ